MPTAPPQRLGLDDPTPHLRAHSAVGRRIENGPGSYAGSMAGRTARALHATRYASTRRRNNHARIPSPVFSVAARFRPRGLTARPRSRIQRPGAGAVAGPGSPGATRLHRPRRRQKRAVKGGGVSGVRPERCAFVVADAAGAAVDHTICPDCVRNGRRRAHGRAKVHRGRISPSRQKRSRQHRLALRSGAEALGDAVDE